MTHTHTYAYTHFHTHAHTMIWLRPELREHSSLTLACSSAFFTIFCQIYYYITFISSNSQTSQFITNIFEYSNILHQISGIWIWILNFLVTNIFDICIRPISKERIYSIFVFDQFPKNEYIRYSYSINLLITNIFDICIWPIC